MKDVHVVITGMGAVSPFGTDLESLWTGVLSGPSATRILSGPGFPEGERAFLGAPSPFAEEHGLSPAQARKYDRFVLMAICAAGQALVDAKLEDPDGRAATGVYFGTGLGGMQTLYEASEVADGRKMSPFLVPKMIPNMGAAAIAMIYGLAGPSLTVCTACAASANAVGEALWAMRASRMERCLVAGAEALFVPTVMGGLYSAKALSRRVDDPATASRPFALGRDGMVMGEGAGAVLLETEESAAARGAEVLGTLVGYGMSADAYHPTAPDPSGRGQKEAMQQALSLSGLTPKDIDYINAHGTSTPTGDAVEAESLRAVFGADMPPVSSTKGATGHLMGAGGVLELALCVLALRRQLLPPSLNAVPVDPGIDLPLVLGPTPFRGRVAMSNAFGFGGQNACLIVTS